MMGGAQKVRFDEEKMKEVNELATKLSVPTSSCSKKGGPQRTRSPQNIRDLMKEINQDFETSLDSYMKVFGVSLDVGMKSFKQEITEVLKQEVRGVKERIYERIIDPVCAWYARLKMFLTAF